MRYGQYTALIVVDMQNDFVDPKGGLYVKEAEEVVEGINLEVAEALLHGTLVVYTQDWHPEHTPHFDTWPVHCVENTWGAEFHPGLAIPLNSYLVQKGKGQSDGYSGFYQKLPDESEDTTALLEILDFHDIEFVVVVGIAGDVCVKATALDAQHLGFSTTVLWSLTRSVNLEKGDDERAINELIGLGVHVALA